MNILRYRKLALYLIFYYFLVCCPVVSGSGVRPADSHQLAIKPFGSDWPDGPGSEITAAICNTCHSLAIVKQQKQTKEGWKELLEWMEEEQGMPELGENEDLVLDYLTRQFGLQTSTPK